MSLSAKKALFRLDAGKQYGLGHLMRSMALADALSKQAIECTFAVKHIHDQHAIKPHYLLVIKSELEFLSLAEHYNIIIIDHYEYASELFYQLSKLMHSALIVIDDEANRGQLYADMIVNSLKQANLSVYKQQSPKAQLLLGWDYVLLGKHFAEQKMMAYKQRQSIIINFGGADVTSLTLPVLQQIKKTLLSEFTIIVVTGAACQQHLAIEAYCQQQSFDYHHDVKNMALLLSRGALAIAAAGSSIFELAYCGVPSVLAVVADNQLLSCQEQQQYGWCTMVDCRRGDHSSEQATALLDKAQQMIHSGQLESYSKMARSLINGRGAERVAIEINQLCN